MVHHHITMLTGVILDPLQRTTNISDVLRSQERNFGSSTAYPYQALKGKMSQKLFVFFYLIVIMTLGHAEKGNSFLFFFFLTVNSSLVFLFPHIQSFILK